MRKDSTMTRKNKLARASLLLSGLGLCGLGFGDSALLAGSPEVARSARSAFYEGNADGYDVQPVSMLRDCGPGGCSTEGAGCEAEGEEDEDKCTGLLMPAFDTCCDGNLLADHGWTLSGYTAFSYTFNPDSPRSRTNGPVSFNDRSNDFLFNALNITLSKDVDTESDCFNFGGRVDFMAGADARWTKSLGFDDGWATGIEHYSIAMPQIYAEVFSPVLNGITTKIGHFYTPIGYEVVPATGNFFASHAYTMQYGEPFTHWGALSTTSLTDQITLTTGTVVGWDDLENNLDGNFSGILGLTWASEETGTSIALTGISGNEGDAQGGRSNRFMTSLVVSQSLGDNWSYVFQSDYGVQRNGTAISDANWYGVNQYLFYTVNDCLKLGGRAEWFRDDEGVRVATLTPANFVNNSGNFYQVTLGANYTPASCVTIRPEVRYDWADNGNRPYDDGTEGKQWLFATDVVIRF